MGKAFDAEAVFNRLMERSQRAEFIGGPADGRVESMPEGVATQVFHVGDPHDNRSVELYEWGGETRPDGTRMFRYKGPRTRRRKGLEP